MLNIGQIYTHLLSQSSSSSSNLTATEQTDEVSQQTCKSPSFSHLQSILKHLHHHAFFTFCQHKMYKINSPQGDSGDWLIRLLYHSNMVTPPSKFNGTKLLRLWDAPVCSEVEPQQQRIHPTGSVRIAWHSGLFWDGLGGICIPCFQMLRNGGVTLNQKWVGVHRCKNCGISALTHSLFPPAPLKCASFLLCHQQQKREGAAQISGKNTALHFHEILLWMVLKSKPAFNKVHVTWNQYFY